MHISYWFSSPDGDVPVDPETLARPFMVEPLRDHPFMALGDFFHVIRLFLLDRAGPVLTALLSRSWGRDVTIADIDSLIIRYEKYGTLYQIVSAEVLSGKLRAKFAVSAALTDMARESMTTEYNLILYMRTKTELPYLPRLFCINTLDVEKDNQVETVVLTLGEWFEGYHEWHFSKDDAGKDRIVLWDMGAGNRPVSDEVANRIIREAAKILTLYYDVDTQERIIPWHHGAGDFVVKTEDDHIEVRLVTIRGYEPILAPDTASLDTFRALLLFFVELVTKMRMDKNEGMGDTTWAEATFASAAVDGFMEALNIKEPKGACGNLKVEDFVTALRALTHGEIEEIINFQLDDYKSRDPSDYEVVRAHLKENANDIVSTLKNLPPLRK